MNRAGSQRNTEMCARSCELEPGARKQSLCTEQEGGAGNPNKKQGTGQWSRDLKQGAGTGSQSSETELEAGDGNRVPGT